MMICITGAGGKTSLLYTLAGKAHAAGRHTAVSTTTHIRQPNTDYPFPVVGTPCEEGKFSSLSAEELERWNEAVDFLLLEADGAKQMPLKVPAAYEPVIPAACRRVIGVMGMDAPGHPLRDVCFRLREAQALLGCGPDHIVTLEDMAAIALSKDGLAKGTEGKEFFIVLNKCEGERIEAARKLRRMLQTQGAGSVVLTVRGLPLLGEEDVYDSLLG